MAEEKEKLLKKQKAGDIMNDPGALADAQTEQDSKSKSLVFYHSLPPQVKSRVKALKNIQFQSLKVEAEFFRKMSDLEREFEARYKPIYEKRRTIVSGDYEPVDEDCEWPDDDDAEDEENGHSEDKKNDKKTDSGDSQGVQAGIPEFWLTIFRNVPLLAECKEDCDDEILSSLRDIQCYVNPPDSRNGYTLEFHFGPNDYFTDTVLKKEYYVRFDPPAYDPLSYEGPEIIESKGCPIHWKTGKNVTVKTVKKTMRHKNRGEKKTISKTVKTNSFFNFFDPPKGCLDDMDGEDDDMDEDQEGDMQADFELGQFIREQVIPRAVLLYTGEGIEDDDEFTSDEEEEEEDEEVD